MKKMYTVRFEIESVVLAESPEDARSVVVSHGLDILRNDGYPELWRVGNEITERRMLPSGWHLSSIPWGEEDDRTVGEYLPTPKRCDGTYVDFQGALRDCLTGGEGCCLEGCRARHEPSGGY